MEYTAVQGGDLADLSATVNAHLSQGWSLQGGICSFVIHTRYEAGYEVNRLETWFCQALAREIPHGV
jgi:hypothetical protein